MTAVQTRLGVVLVVLAVVVGMTAPAVAATPQDGSAQQRGFLGDSFDVSNLSAPSNASAGDTVAVAADVSNPADFPDIQLVELRVDGELVDVRPFALNPNETERLSFDLDTTGLAEGEHVVSVSTDLHGEVATFTVGEGDGTAPPTNETASVDFEDQRSGGDSVTVASASNASAPFYVAVWTVNETTDERDALLGFERANDTSAENVSVALDRALDESGTLIAAVHPDGDGERDTTDPDTEAVLATDTAQVTVGAESGDDDGVGDDADGNATDDAGGANDIADNATDDTTDNATDTADDANATANVTFDDQTSDGRDVRVANASNASAPFYVAIWTANETTSGPDELIGYFQVTDTSIENVSIMADDLAESRTLIAAIHPDQDGEAVTIDPDTSDILASDTAEVEVNATTTT